MSSLRAQITELREALGPSIEQYVDKLSKALMLALRGKAQVHVADAAGARGEMDIWLEPMDVADLNPKDVERVLTLVLGSKPKVSAKVTHDDEDGILVTVARLAA
jgi:hypothetical protein